MWTGKIAENVVECLRHRVGPLLMGLQANLETLDLRFEHLGYNRLAEIVRDTIICREYRAQLLSEVVSHGLWQSRRSTLCRLV